MQACNLKERKGSATESNGGQELEFKLDEGIKKVIMLSGNSLYIENRLFSKWRWDNGNYYG